MARNQDNTKESEVKERLHILTEEYYENYLNLLFNSIKINGLPQDEPIEYALNVLFIRGFIGAIKLDGKYYLVNADKVGNINRFGKSLFYRVVFADGKMLKGKFKLNEDIYIIRLNPRAYSFKNWLYHKSEEMARVDIAIQNNLEASSLGFIIETEGNELTVRTALKKGRDGDFCIFKRNNNDLFKITPLNQEYIGDKLLEHKQKINNEVYARMGIVAGVSDKAERVQSYDLPLDVAIDSIYTIIDTFNHDCNTFNLPFDMQLNGAIEELYNSNNIENGDEQNDN